MIAQLMVQPSSFIRSGVQMSHIGDVSIFKFTDQLQARMEALLSQNKQDALTDAERAELDGITELSRVFTLINAQLAAQAKWCPAKLEDLSGKASYKDRECSVLGIKVKVQSSCSGKDETF